MADYEEDRLRIDKRKGRDLQLDGGTLKRAYRETKNLPQAVLKVSSYAHGASKADAHLKYISRKGDVEVEDPQGSRLSDPEELKERIDEWSDDFDKRKDSRDTVNIVLSAPKNADRVSTEKAVRAFASKTFGETNDYLFAIHNDTEHPHGHLMVKMRGYDGEKLNPGKADLRRWRETFAESLRENGIEVDATPRYKRGVGQKGHKQSLHHLRKRETPKVDKEAVKEAIQDFNNKEDTKNKKWVLSSKKRTELHKAELKLIAQKTHEAALKSGNDNLQDMAKKIALHAEKIPVPQSRAEIYQDKLEKQTRDADQER